MNTTRLKPAILAALVVAATVLSAAVRPLPTPQLSPFPDRESSTCATLTGWPDLGRNIILTISALATPSNAVQVAFGQDTNGDSDLAPEETQIFLGVDCGVPFIREEVNVGKWKSGILSALEEESTLDCSPSPLTFTFSLKQPSAVSARFDFAKITTRGREETAAQIAAQITRPGVALILR